MTKDKKKVMPVIDNRRASFEYELLEKFSAGIVLRGTEIKSLREGKANLQDAFCMFKDEELWIKNMHISEYSHGNLMNHDPLTLRKLLLSKKELGRLHAKVKERGFTIIPIKIFFSERGFAKVDIALARGKKSFDKRASIREKDMKRESDRYFRIK